MDGLDAELVGNQLADECQRLFSRRSGDALATYFVTERPADAVAVVAVGDEYIIRTDLGSNCCDALGVGNALDDVFDTFNSHRRQ